MTEEEQLQPKKCALNGGPLDGEEWELNPAVQWFVVPHTFVKGGLEHDSSWYDRNGRYMFSERYIMHEGRYLKVGTYYWWTKPFEIVARISFQDLREDQP